MTNKDLLIRYVKLAAVLTEYQINKLNNNLKKSYIRRRLQEWDAANSRLKGYEIKLLQKLDPKKASDYLDELVETARTLTLDEIEILNWSPEQIHEYKKDLINKGNFLSDEEFNAAPEELKYLQVQNLMAKEHLLSAYEFEYAPDDYKVKYAQDRITRGRDVSLRELQVVNIETQKIYVDNIIDGYKKVMEPEALKILDDNNKRYYFQRVIDKKKMVLSDYELSILPQDLRPKYIEKNIIEGEGVISNDLYDKLSQSEKEWGIIYGFQLQKDKVYPSIAFFSKYITVHPDRVWSLIINVVEKCGKLPEKAFLMLNDDTQYQLIDWCVKNSKHFFYTFECRRNWSERVKSRFWDLQIDMRDDFIIGLDELSPEQLKRHFYKKIKNGEKFRDGDYQFAPQEIVDKKVLDMIDKGFVYNLSFDENVYNNASQEVIDKYYLYVFNNNQSIVCNFQLKRMSQHIQRELINRGVNGELEFAVDLIEVLPTKSREQYVINKIKLGTKIPIYGINKANLSEEVWGMYILYTYKIEGELSDSWFEQAPESVKTYILKNRLANNKWLSRSETKYAENNGFEI